jgi:hypothetical protein
VFPPPFPRLGTGYPLYESVETKIRIGGVTHSPIKLKHDEQNPYLINEKFSKK